MSGGHLGIADTPAPEPPAKAAAAPALEQALDEAKSALASMTRTREAERLAVGDALLQTRQRMQAALADAEERHAQSAIQWAAEKDSLQSELTKTREDAGAAASRPEALTSDLAQAREAAGAAASKLAALDNDLAQAREAAGAAAARLESSQSEMAQAREAAHQAAAHLQARERELAQARMPRQPRRRRCPPLRASWPRPARRQTARRRS